MSELNRDQIVKALECCASPTQMCKDCPMPEEVKDDCRCMETISRNALSLIKELTEENERLKRLCELRERDHNDALDLLYKAEADTLENIKIQFAMRYGTYTDKDMTPITEVFRLLDQIAKEMIGEGDNESKG